MTALRCLAYFMTKSNKDKLKCSDKIEIPYMYVKGMVRQLYRVTLKL